MELWLDPPAPEPPKMPYSSSPITSGPLEGFVRLGKFVHHYTPANVDISDSEPGLVVLCSWAFAQPKHIAKYLKGYQNTFPRTPILLVQQDINNMLFRPDSWQYTLFQPAADTIKTYIDSLGQSPIKLLLHTFSNGGSHSAVQLGETYRRTYHTEMPITAEVMDSTPGVPRYNETAAALSSGLPKSFPAYAIGKVAMYSMLNTTIFMHYFGISELATVKLYRTLNDPNEAFLKPHIPRTYIYSDTDVMILTRDVLAHAEMARKTLNKDSEKPDLIHTEEFINTPHANHMSQDPARYWQIVRDTFAKGEIS